MSVAKGRSIVGVVIRKGLHNMINNNCFFKTIPFSDNIINLMVDILGGQGGQRGHRP